MIAFIYFWLKRFVYLEKIKLHFGDNFRKSLIIDLWRNCLLHHTPQTNLLNQMYSFVRSIIQCQVVPLHPLTFNGSGSKPNEDPGLAMSSRLRMTRIFQVTRFKINSLFSPHKQVKNWVWYLASRLHRMTFLSDFGNKFGNCYFNFYIKLLSI